MMIFCLTACKNYDSILYVFNLTVNTRSWHQTLLWPIIVIRNYCVVIKGGRNVSVVSCPVFFVKTKGLCSIPRLGN